jgi:hypothetical protein
MKQKYIPFFLFLLALFFACNNYNKQEKRNNRIEDSKRYDYKYYPTSSAGFLDKNTLPDRYAQIADLDEKDIYIDADAIVEEKDTIKVWVLTVHKTLDSKTHYVDMLIKNLLYSGLKDVKKFEVLNYSNYSHSLHYCAVNCKDNMIKPLTKVDYNVDRTIIIRDDIETFAINKWVPIAPGSLGEALVYFLCNSEVNNAMLE